MTRKIDDFVKSEPAFPDATSVKSEDLKGAKITLKGCALRQGDDGNFFIVLADKDGEEISFSNGGVAVVKAINSILKADGLEASEDAVMFKEPVECILSEVKSKSGRNYYVFAPVE